MLYVNGLLIYSQQLSYQTILSEFNRCQNGLKSTRLMGRLKCAFMLQRFLIVKPHTEESQTHWSQTDTFSGSVEPNNVLNARLLMETHTSINIKELSLDGENANQKWAAPLSLDKTLKQEHFKFSKSCKRANRETVFITLY